MAHSDTKVKINDDREPLCYRPLQIADTSHSCLPRHTLKAGVLPGFNPKYQTKRKTILCLNNIIWFNYFTNYITMSQPPVLQSHDRWPILSLYTTKKIFSQSTLLQYTNILARCMCLIMRILLYDPCKLIYLAHTT
jgi:hypothetical protein